MAGNVVMDRLDKLDEASRDFTNRIESIEDISKNIKQAPIIYGYQGKRFDLNDNLDVVKLLSRVTSAEADIVTNNTYTTTVVSSGGHTHDTDTLQMDGVNSNGGAFPFTTTGQVTFNQSIKTEGGLEVVGDAEVTGDVAITGTLTMETGTADTIPKWSATKTLVATNLTHTDALGDMVFTAGPTGQFRIDANSVVHQRTAGAFRVTQDAILGNSYCAQIEQSNGDTMGKSYTTLGVSSSAGSVITTGHSTVIGIKSQVQKGGADTSAGTFDLMAVWGHATSQGSTDAGTKNTYGGHFTAEGDTAGASTCYGVYCTASGADTNWAGYFAWNVGITGAITISADVATITHSGTTSLTIASTSGTVAIESVTFTGANVTGMGTLGCGAITIADGGSLNLQEDITFLGATTENQIVIPTNLADALSVKDAAGTLMQFVTTTGSQALNITPNTVITGTLRSGHMAVGTNPNNDIGFYHTETFTDTDNSSKAGVISLSYFAKTAAEMTSTGAATAGLAYLAASNTQNWSNANAIAGVVATFGTVAGSTGTINSAVGLWARGLIVDAATITNFCGVKIAATEAAGNKLINNYGLYIEDQNVGATLNYAIYTNAGLVRFGDAVTMTSTLGCGAITSTGASTFNSGSTDSDFTVNWNTGVGLFVQGSDGFVGIGIAAPTMQLHIYKAAENCEFTVEAEHAAKRPAFYLKRDGGNRAGFYYYGSGVAGSYTGDMLINLDAGDLHFTGMGYTYFTAATQFSQFVKILYNNSTTLELESTTGAGIKLNDTGENHYWGITAIAAGPELRFSYDSMVNGNCLKLQSDFTAIFAGNIQIASDTNGLVLG
ncbi:MAG TPA: hypothetical protein VMV77_16820, partial [Bacteroidales bacterium]|nr:hypothetical protein [Bacteroidales bacterium]